MNQEIEQKIQELNDALQKHAPANAVSFELFINASEVKATISARTLQQLKTDGISMRNLAGEFIK
jgi:hypothetical protein